MIYRTAKIFHLDAERPNYNVKNICIRNVAPVMSTYFIAICE